MENYAKIAQIIPQRITAWPKALDITKEAGKIVHIDKEGKIFFLTYAEIEFLGKMTAMLNKRYSSEPQHIWHMGSIVPGLPVVARWHVDGNFYRAEVIRQSTKNARYFWVRFVDFGNKEYINVADLRSRVLTYGTPVQAHKFELAGVAPKSADCWSSDELDFLFDAVKDKPCVVQVIEGGKPNKELKAIKVGVKGGIEDLAAYAIEAGQLSRSSKSF